MSGRAPHVLRDWAVTDPQRYFLVHGTPIPGYRAPEDIAAVSSEIMALLPDAGRELTPTTTLTLFDPDLESRRDRAGDHPARPGPLHRFLTLWTRLHGVLSLELAGHFTGMDFDPALPFTAELDGLPAPAPEAAGGVPLPAHRRARRRAPVEAAGTE
ncbi:TetR-like C-terminal domain-containing protein [Streptomyces sp. Qhu_M48]|uniref:TetR-like C-terminal domain-containing protein n=1 Tax=Streptomyces sp. Qhu_M48 TaxID=3435889 RepID=UPI003F5048ED